SQRRLISVDQFLVPKVDKAFIKEVGPLQTMAEVEELLKRKNMEYIPGANVLDSLSLAPEAAAKIGDLGNDEVIIAPSGGGGATISRITAKRIVPLVGPEAERVARLLLTQQRNSSQVRKGIEEIVK